MNQSAIFTDAAAALDEAVWLAEQEDKPQAIVTHATDPCALEVISYTQAWYERREILEVCDPIREDAA